MFAPLCCTPQLANFIKIYPMKLLPPRIAIYTKDVMNITGRKERTARKLLAKIRRHFSKPKDAFISIEEFCKYTGFNEEKINSFL